MILREPLPGVSIADIWRAAQIAVLVVGFGAAQGLSNEPQAHEGTTVRRFSPFVVRQQTTYFPPDSKTTPVARERTFAVRSDGSLIVSFSSAAPDGEIATTIQIWDRRSNQEIVLEPFTQSRITTRLTEDSWLAALEANYPACPQADSEAARNARDAGEMFGFRVHKVEAWRPGMRTEMIMAPALDCLVLSKIIRFSSGSRNETVTLSVSTGEPDVSLFSLPGGFVERSPAELESAYAAKYSGRVFFGKVALKAAEARYRKYKLR